MNRRAFLSTGAAAFAVAGRMLQAAPYNLPVGLQIYSVRDQAKADLHGTLKRVAQIGYKEIEIAGVGDASPAEWRKLLSDNGLSAPSGHFSLANARSGWEKHIESAHATGMKYMVMAFLDAVDRKTIDDYKKVAALFNSAAEQTKQAGIQFCYHNHNFEFIDFNGNNGWNVLVKETDPKLVRFEMDCFWVIHAGQNPVKFMQAHPGRFPLLHIKDLKAGNPPTTKVDARVGLFAPVGSGTIDWKPIFAAAKKGGLEHYFVEQDYCEGSPFDAIQSSYDYLKHLSV